ncbi:MAG: 4Fe-4S binding protein [Candidatus Omnitrophica bacterium]|nr:4Fe-4S binding protein [Candidatus Omnitrophota bacterium]
MALMRIDTQKCKGCLLCITVCPRAALKEGARLNRFGAEPPVFDEKSGCSGCGRCALICPDTCIEIYEE